MGIAVKRNAGSQHFVCFFTRSLVSEDTARCLFVIHNEYGHTECRVHACMQRAFYVQAPDRVCKRACK